MAWFEENVSSKKICLAEQVKAPIAYLATICAYDWNSATRITELLAQEFHKLPHCQKLYAMNSGYLQIGASIIKNDVDMSANGYNHTGQPYCSGSLPFRGLILTSAYTCNDSRPLITTIQAINHNNTLLGFVAADFDLHNLPISTISSSRYPWQQVKGDLAIRNNTFLRKRTQSELDKNIESVLDDLSNLFSDHGVFYSVIHFSSSICTLWSEDDPYNYRIHNIKEMTDSELFLIYPGRTYSDKARVAPEKISLVLAMFKTLRKLDDTFYLRSASLNIMNNMIGLTFSSDGSHYMTVDDFLEKQLGFWTEIRTLSKTA